MAAPNCSCSACRPDCVCRSIHHLHVASRAVRFWGSSTFAVVAEAPNCTRRTRPPVTGSVEESWVGPAIHQISLRHLCQQGRPPTTLLATLDPPLNRDAMWVEAWEHSVGIKTTQENRMVLARFSDVLCELSEKPRVCRSVAPIWLRIGRLWTIYKVRAKLESDIPVLFSRAEA